MSLAELTIPMDSLRRLPPGAAYTKKLGTTRLTASVDGDSLHITSESEGATRQSYVEEENRVHIRDQLEQVQQQSKPAESPFKWYLYGVLTGIVLTVITILIIKKKRK